MLAYAFILVAVALRFLPHPLDFTPVGAALLYFAARGPRKQLWVPLVLLAASDVILTTVVYRYPFTWDHFVTWAWYVGMLGLGSTLKQRAGRHRLLLRLRSGAAEMRSIAFTAIAVLIVVRSSTRISACASAVSIGTASSL